MTEKPIATDFDPSGLRNIATWLENLNKNALHAGSSAELIREAADSIEELEQLFDLRYKADMRAVARWRAEKPGRDLTLPDHADLCVWLMEQLEAKQEIERQEKCGANQNDYTNKPPEGGSSR